MRRSRGANALMERLRTPRIRKMCAASAVLLALFGAVMWYRHSAWPGYVREQAALWHLSVSRRLGLTLQNVYLEGQRYAPTEDILQALDVKLGQPILTIEIERLKERLEKLDWVRYAAVEREWPHTLHIRILEREPVAIWQHHGAFSLIDHSGRVIKEDDMTPFSHLIVVVGDDAPAYTESLLALLHKEPELAKRVTAAVRVGERRWNLHFASGMEVRLPEENEEDAWRFLRQLYERKKLGEEVRRVDLRIPDKVYIQGVPKAEGRKLMGETLPSSL